MISLKTVNFTYVLESIPDGIVLFAPNREVFFANRAASQLSGLPQEAFYLNELKRLLEEKISINLENAIMKVLQVGVPVHLNDVQIVSFFYEFFIVPIYGLKKEITGGIIVMHDVTNRVELDHAKSEFVSLASHQLRTPLSIISWYSEMLLAGDAGSLTQQQEECFKEIQNGNTRMVRLVNDLLNLARIEGGQLKIEPISMQLEESVRTIAEEVKDLASARNCTIHIEPPKSKLPEILIDPILLHQVLSNILSNAIRYSPEDKQCEVVVAFKKEYERVIISVKDGGIGIPEEAQKNIFERFFRADNAKNMDGEGSGLGLSIAKMMLEATGGKIWFESKEGKGTTFYVGLPLSGMKKKEGTKTLAT